MIFNSIQFTIFFPMIVLLYYFLPKRAKIFLLLTASYLFYMCWDAKYVVCLLFITFLTFAVSHLFRYEKYKRVFLYIGICGSLFVLFFYKYTSFLVGSINAVLGNFSITLPDPAAGIILPVGISFYTFQALGYLIDVYKGKIEAERNIAIYALFVGFFPLILSGPIERAKNLIPQLKNPPSFKTENIKNGFLLMAYGYFLKLVIADRASIFVNNVYKDYQAYSGIILFIASVLFSIQIYCDFCGYSLIAIGSAEALGFKIIKNFEQPYFAVSVQDFWRRWHISLSSWFKDYVYIPLGGSRCGRFRRYANLFITFCVSGLWHGANWTFIIWGGLNGALQIIGHFTKNIRDDIIRIFRVKTNCFSYRFFQKLLTFLMINITWIFFKSDNIKMAVTILCNMCRADNVWVLFDHSLLNLGLGLSEWLILLFAVFILLGVDLAHEHGVHLRQKFSEQNFLFRWIIYIGAAMGILLFGVYGPQFSASEFIYFQF